MNSILSFFRKAPAVRAPHYVARKAPAVRRMPSYIAIRMLTGRAGNDLRIYETPGEVFSWQVESKGGLDCTEDILARLCLDKDAVISDIGLSLERNLQHRGFQVTRSSWCLDPRAFC